MIVITRSALQNGLIFIEDEKGGRPPSVEGEKKIRHTSSCISVECLNEIDGETEITLCEIEDLVSGEPESFDGTVETPSKKLIVSGVYGNIILKTAVRSEVTHIKIWRNNLEWADRIIVAWS